MKEKEKLRNKAVINEIEIKNKIDFFLKMNIPFQISVSNYSVKIESNFESVHYIKKARSKKLFLAYYLIKDNISNLPAPVNYEFINYYQTNFRNGYIYSDKIFQVDIKSCYANILKNENIITQKAYNSISCLKKEDRLAVIGMLASKKDIFNFDSNGRVVSHITDINEYADYFFFCVQKTFEIMMYMRGIIGNNFLFSWVDAIYFMGGEKEGGKIQDILMNKYKLESSFCELREFEVKGMIDFYKISYKKNGIYSFMNIPKPSQHEKEGIIKYLINKKIQ